jgi:N-hydroxyarylamine O-acetyltransferase
MDVLQRDYNGEWKRQYFFDLIPRIFPDDYEAACIYHQTSPQSIFTQKSVISIATREGRVTLDEDHLIVTKLGERTEKVINHEERAALLIKYFGVHL